MNIDELTYGQIKEIAALAGSKCQTSRSAFVVGKNYFIRTVTHILTGKLVRIIGEDLVLVDACWVADTRRYADIFTDGFTAEAELEPYPDGAEVIVNRGALVDAVEWTRDLPRKQQ
jgi:hypothetical protein